MEGSCKSEVEVDRTWSTLEAVLDRGCPVRVTLSLWGGPTLFASLSPALPPHPISYFSFLFGNSANRSLPGNFFEACAKLAL